MTLPTRCSTQTDPILTAILTAFQLRRGRVIRSLALGHGLRPGANGNAGAVPEANVSGHAA